MATTTTLYPTADTYLQQDQPATNKATETLLRVGQFNSNNRRHGLFLFETDTLTEPSRIISSILTLKEQGTFGSSVRTMKLCRNGETDTDISSATWNTYDGTNTWSDGGEEDSQQTEPMYTVSVGNSIGNAIVDINDLVVDATKRRNDELNLTLCFDKTDTDTSQIGNSKFYSVNHATTSLRPKLEVTVADVIYWQGGVSGDVDNGLNWASIGGGNALPTNNDYVVFNDGGVDVTGGTINCDSMFVGEGYTGNIGTESTQITIRADGDRENTADKKLVINKRVGLFNLKAYTLTKQSVYISNCPENCKYENTTVAYNCYINKTGASVELVGNSSLVTTSDGASIKAKLSGTLTDVVASGSRLTLESGSNTFVATNGAKITCESGDLSELTGSVIAGNSVVRHLGNVINGDVSIYYGSMDFKGNEHGSIQTEDIMLWKRGVFDPRTGVGAWNVTASPSIDLRGGGNFIVDSGRTITIT